MGWVGDAIDGLARKTAREAVSEYFASESFKAVLDEMIQSSPVFRFRKAMQRRYLERRPGLTPKQAWDHAGIALGEHLRGDRIEFGDPRYAWDDAGARDIVDADLEYWDE